MSKRSETRDPERSCKGRNELSSSLAEEKVDRQKTLPQAGGEARQQITAWDDSASKSGLTKTQKEKKKKRQRTLFEAFFFADEAELEEGRYV
jgi:hypothetical protein